MAISSFKEVVTRIAGRLRPDALVMDTCSVKVYPAQVMGSLLPPSVQIIATHPMFGPDSAKNGLAGLPLVFSPIRADSDAADRWLQTFRSMGLQVLKMDCDFMTGGSYSRSDDFVGRVLDELHLKSTEIATLGYRNLMTIVEQTCNDPLQLFYDLQRYNPYAHDMHLRLKDALDTVLAVLDAQDNASMEIR